MQASPPRAYSSNEKRDHLVAAAGQLLHEQGFHRTTLADVASHAQVPLGNLYYYFKTKEALAEAVILAHEDALHALFASWTSAHAEPRKRLRRLVRAPLDAADRVTQFGCPHGSLCQELDKLGEGAPLASAGMRLLSVYIDWAEAQFRAHGVASAEARALATDLVGAVQGAMLLANTMRSKDLLARQLRRVEKWVDDALTSVPRKGK
jgi:AcrR family transcriptional regulator